MANSGADGRGGTLRAQWRARLRRFARDGRSVAQFCAAEGVSAWSFYNWRRKLGDEIGIGTPQAAAANAQVPALQASGFIDAGVACLRGEQGSGPLQRVETTGLELRIDLGGGVLLQIVRR
jgi:transposase-like protein